MVPGFCKFITNGTLVFYFYHKWYLFTQNNLFKNQLDETIHSVKKKKKKRTKHNQS